ncbi:MAG: hypothetical protein NTZ80_01475 [Patescibacteria group bacterium]|nr:hypothetical protein [Patescibacteria group bacterium]
MIHIITEESLWAYEPGWGYGVKERRDEQTYSYASCANQITSYPIRNDWVRIITEVQPNHHWKWFFRKERCQTLPRNKFICARTKQDDIVILKGKDRTKRCLLMFGIQNFFDYRNPPKLTDAMRVLRKKTTAQVILEAFQHTLVNSRRGDRYIRNHFYGIAILNVDDTLAIRKDQGTSITYTWTGRRLIKHVGDLLIQSNQVLQKGIHVADVKPEKIY